MIIVYEKVARLKRFLTVEVTLFGATLFEETLVYKTGLPEHAAEPDAIMMEKTPENRDSPALSNNDSNHYTARKSAVALYLQYTTA